MDRRASTLTPPPVARDTAPDGAFAHARDRSGPSGLGGWLTVVGLWLAFTVLTMGWGWVLLLMPASLAGLWEIATDPQTKLFLRIFTGVSLISMTLLSVASVAALYGFFRRARWFPRVLIAFVATCLVSEAVMLAMAAAGRASVSGGFVLSSGLVLDVAGRLAYPLAYVLVLTPYLLRSRRVRNTFVR